MRSSWYGIVDLFAGSSSDEKEVINFVASNADVGGAIIDTADGLQTFDSADCLQYCSSTRPTPVFRIGAACITVNGCVGMQQKEEITSTSPLAFNNLSFQILSSYCLKILTCSRYVGSLAVVLSAFGLFAYDHEKSVSLIAGKK